MDKNLQMGTPEVWNIEAAGVFSVVGKIVDFAMFLIEENGYFVGEISDIFENFLDSVAAIIVADGGVVAESEEFSVFFVELISGVKDIAGKGIKCGGIDRFWCWIGILTGCVVRHVYHSF